MSEQAEPWEAVREFPGATWMDIYHVASGECIAKYVDPKNAFVMAASRELLAACEKVVNNWGDLHPKDRAQLRAAIALARASKVPA